MKQTSLSPPASDITIGPDSAEFVKEYGKLRRSGTSIEQALVLVGYEFRLT